MPAYTLSHVSDEALIAELAALVATDRQTTAALLAHIAEVDARGLYRPAACSTMHSYCMRVLHLSEDAAFKRIRAARVARRYPQIFEAIGDGRLHLSGVVVLGPHLTDENVDELIGEAAYCSKAEIEMIVARVAPRPDVPPVIAPVAVQAELGQGDGRSLAPGPVERVSEMVTRVKPLAPERFALQVTIGEETRGKLERAQALLRHRNPSGDLAEVIGLALDALIEKLEKKKFGVTDRPRRGKARKEDADPRYVPNDVKRDVHRRDDEQCSFVSDDGVRCTERGFLELDHRTPVAFGGKPTVRGTRLLCWSHNQWEAERLMGADLMRRKRDEARAKREAARAKRGATARGDDTPLDDVELAEAPAVEEARAAVDDAELARATAVEGDAVAAVGPGAGQRTVDADVSAALRGMGFKANETRRAMMETAGGAVTFEARLRAALAALPKANRCSDGELRYRPAEDAPWPLVWH